MLSCNKIGVLQVAVLTKDQVNVQINVLQTKVIMLTAPISKSHHLQIIVKQQKSGIICVCHVVSGEM